MKRMNKLIAAATILVFAITVVLPFAAFAAEGDWTMTVTPTTLEKKVGETIDLSSALTVKVEVEGDTGTKTDVPSSGYDLSYAASPGSALTIDESTATVTDEGNETVTVTATGTGTNDGSTATADVTVTTTKWDKPVISANPELDAVKIMQEVTLTVPALSSPPTGTELLWTVNGTDITAENAEENNASLDGDTLKVTPPDETTITVTAQWIIPAGDGGDPAQIDLSDVSDECEIEAAKWDAPTLTPATKTVKVGEETAISAAAPTGLPADAFIAWDNGEAINETAAMPDPAPAGVISLDATSLTYAAQEPGTVTVNGQWVMPDPSAGSGGGARTAPSGTIELSDATTDGCVLTVEKAELTVAVSAGLAGDPCTLTATITPSTAKDNVDGFEITWPAGFTADPENPLVATGTTPDEPNDSATATAQNGEGTAITDEVTFTIAPRDPAFGDLTITPSVTQVKPGETLTATAGNTGTDPLPDTTSYTWTVTGGGSASPSSGTSTSTTVTAPTNLGKFTVQVAAAGLTAQVEIEVTDTPAEPSAEPSSGASASAAPSASASSQPSSSAGTEYPPASGGSTASNAPSAQPSSAPSGESSSEPSGTASAEPSTEPSGDTSGEPSTEPSSQPSAEPNTPADEVPIEPAEDAPVDFDITDNPDGSGSVLTGIDVATDNEQTAANAVENLIDSMQVPEGQSVEVVDKDGEPVAMGDPVATGMIVQVISDDGTVISTTAIVVKGDVTGTGEMNLTQLVRLAAAFQGAEPLTGAYLMAGDLAGDDGEITLTDLVRMAALYKTYTEAAES